MKFIKLITSAHVNGVLRHPHEGVLHVSDEEGQRVIGNACAIDVSEDFTEQQDAHAPADTITTDPKGGPRRGKPAAEAKE